MGIRLVPNQDHSQIERIADKQFAERLLQRRHTLILLLSASGLSGVQIAQKIGRSEQTLREIYSYTIYPTLEAKNQRHAVLKAVEFGVLTLSQLLKDYLWEEREPLSVSEYITLVCLLRDCAIPDTEVAKRVPQSLSQFRVNVLKAKMKLKIDNDAQLCVVTLASLAAVLNLEVPPLPGEHEAIRRNLAFFERVPYPYPQQWHDFVAGAAALFPPTLKH